MHKCNKSFVQILLPCIFMILLAVIIVFIIIRYLERDKMEDDPMLHILRKRLMGVHPIVENMNLYKGKKSYTLNKDKIFMCLNDKNGDYYDENTLTYVLLHEMSHKLCDEIGHTEKFHDIFVSLQKRAIDMGVLDPKKQIVKDYCEY